MSAPKYALMYAKDITRPPGEAAAEIVEFDSRWRMLWFIIRDKTARSAVLAQRYHVFRVASDETQRP